MNIAKSQKIVVRTEAGECEIKIALELDVNVNVNNTGEIIDTKANCSAKLLKEKEKESEYIIPDFSLETIKFGDKS